MAIGKPEDIAAATVVHRIGGGDAANLQLSEFDVSLTPPGLSVLLDESPEAAAEQMRRAFPRSRKWRLKSKVVGTTTAMAIRQAGFDVVPDPTDRFPNHARLIHKEGILGFHYEARQALAKEFHNKSE